MEISAEFTLYLTVDDASALQAAAAARAVEDGAFATEQEYREEYGEDDIAAHLRMLLDPGTLAGCSIIDSTAETS